MSSQAAAERQRAKGWRVYADMVAAVEWFVIAVPGYDRPSCVCGRKLLW